jgi:hypothetical protein
VAPARATFRFWDLKTSLPLTPPVVVLGGIDEVQFSKDGTSVFLANGSPFATAQIRTWALPPSYQGSPDDAALWVQSLTGGELRANGERRLLDHSEWMSRIQSAKR